MLVGTITEAIKKQGLSREAREAVWNFAADQETVERLNLHDHLAQARDYWGKNGDLPGAG